MRSRAKKIKGMLNMLIRVPKESRLIRDDFYIKLYGLQVKSYLLSFTLFIFICLFFRHICLAIKLTKIPTYLDLFPFTVLGMI